MKNIFILFLSSLVALSSFAKGPRYSSPLAPVDSTGFYKIQLISNVNSKLKEDFSDLRLFDNENREVPYILKSDNAISYFSRFNEYKIAEKKILKDSITLIKLENSKKDSINNLSLSIRNADVRKAMRLSGSFDQKQWFVVKESEWISSVNNQNDVSEIKLINFPLTNYSFYRLEINDKNSPPVDVIKAGYYESTATQGSYSEIKSVTIISDSSKSKTTWIHLAYDEAVYIDALEINITAPEYFMRDANIYYDNSSVNNNPLKGKILLQRIALSSKASLRFNTNGIKSKALWVEIFNLDNQPLKIKEVRTWQINHYCIAHLEKAQQYELRFGDSLLYAPQYDLKYFESVIPVNLKTVMPRTVLANVQTPEEVKASKVFFTDKRFIWSALILVIALLAFVSYRMMRDFK